MTATTTQALIASTHSFDPWGHKRDKAKLEEHKSICAKLNEEARANWDSEQWHRQVAADLASSLDYGFSFNNIFSQYIQTENVGEFDRVRIRERRGLKVFYTSRGGYIDESQLRTEQWELPRDTLGFHVSEHIDKLRADFATSISDLVSQGEARMEAEVNRRVLTLAQTAIPSTSPYYVATAGLTSTILNTAIRQVRDALQPDGAGFPPVTVIGRAAMVDKIADFIPTYSPIAIEEVRQQGFVGTYRGANILVQRQYLDEDNLSYINANELWVLGGTAGKFALYGGTQVKSWDENTVDYRHYRARKDIGGLIHHPEQMVRIVDSSVTP